MRSEELRERLAVRLKGQDRVLDDLCPSLVERLRQRWKHRPRASLCLIGPRGTGKSVLTEALAESLYGGGKAGVRYDCVEYPGAAGRARLFGSLTRLLLENPRRVIEFDDLDRADPELCGILLEILSQGRLTETDGGRVADLSEAMLILNCGAKYLYANREIADDEELARIVQEIRAGDAGYPVASALGELLRKVDRVCVFRRLTHEAKIEIGALAAVNLAKDYGVELAWIDPDMLSPLVAKFGPREVERELGNLLSDELLAAAEAGWQRVRMEWKDGRPEAVPAPIG